MLPRNNQIFKSERDMMSGGMGLSALMSAANATKTCVQSGNWSDPATWSGGTTPVSGEKVHIPAGLMVIYDVNSAASIDWIRNDGSFKVATGKTTRLVLDTYLGTLTSYTEIGTPVAPADFTMEFVGGVLMAGDMMEMSRGFLTIGRAMIHGRKLIPYVKLPNSVPAGATSVTIPAQYDPQTGAQRNTGADVASSWRVGDKLCFPKSSGTSGEDNVTITGISGAMVTFTPALTKEHNGGAGDPQGLGVGNRKTPLNDIIHRHNSYAINETRSITFKSQDPTGVRGHAMFMHGRGISVTNKHYRRADHKSVPMDLGAEMDPGVSVSYAAWGDMGRTRTISSPRIGEPGNQVGRYSLHFHRTGHWAQDAVVCKGNHIAGNVGWGLVRHDCHVHVDYCTAKGVTAGSNVGGGGALFLDEEDTELGAWTRCLGWSCRGHPGMVDFDGPNNEYAFNGHGHAGVCAAINRQSSAREIIGIDCLSTIHLHQASTNTRLAPGSFKTGNHPVDRRPDIEGMKRRGFLSNPVAWMQHEDNQPGGWFGCEAIYCGAGLSVFHRQQTFMAIDFHAAVENWTTTRVDTPISTTNYTNNYLMRGNSFLDSEGFWAYGDKALGFVWIKNRIENCSSVFMATFGPHADLFNACGGFADNVFVNVPAPPAIAADLTNHDSSAWPAYTFGVEFYDGPYSGSGTAIKYWITDGFVGNVPLYTGRAEYPDYGLKPGAYGRQGKGGNWHHCNIRSPGSDYQRLSGMTAYELVETWGCVPDGSGGHYVPLYFPLRDRLTGDMQWFRTTYDATWMTAAFRTKNEIPADPGPPPTVLVPDVLEDYSLTTYGCFPDPDRAVHYVISDGNILIDAYEAHRDLMIGQSRTVTRTFSFADGGLQVVEFTIDGRGQAPAWVETPRITRQSDYNSWTSIRRGPNFFAPKLLTYDYGSHGGFPHPWNMATAKFSSDAASYIDNPINFGKMDALMTLGKGGTHYDPYQVGHHKMSVVLENDHGTLAAVESNVAQITED